MKDPDDRLLGGYRCKFMSAEATRLGSRPQHRSVLLSCKLPAPPESGMQCM